MFIFICEFFEGTKESAHCCHFSKFSCGTENKALFSDKNKIENMQGSCKAKDPFSWNSVHHTAKLEGEGSQVA